MAKRAAPLFVVGALVACGARTALDDFESSNHEGGGGASTTLITTTSSTAVSASSTSSSTGATGGGGATSSSTGGGGERFRCLSVTGAPTMVPLPPGLDVDSPELVYPSGSSSVALVARLTPPLPPLGVPGEVAVTSIDAWGAWPPSIDIMKPIAATFISSAFATTTSTEDDAFTLLIDAADSAARPGGLAAAIDARTDGSATFSMLSPEHQSALFVAATDDGLAFATQKTDASGAAYSHIEAFGQIAEHQTCGTPPLVGAALSFGDNVVFTLSTQDTNTACASSPPATDARLVALGNLSAAGIDEKKAYLPFYPNEGTVTGLALSRYSGGVWYLMRRVAVGDPESFIEDGAMDDDGTPMVKYTQLPVVVPTGLAMAPWRTDDMFVVADNQNHVRSFVYHRAFGGPDEGDYVDITPMGELLHQYATIAAPSEKQWLVAWTERSADGTFSLWVARIECNA